MGTYNVFGVLGLLLLGSAIWACDSSDEGETAGGGGGAGGSNTGGADPDKPAYDSLATCGEPSPCPGTEAQRVEGAATGTIFLGEEHAAVPAPTTGCAGGKPRSAVAPTTRVSDLGG